MPLWTIHHSAACLTDDDRQHLASGITEIYRMLPPFYVAVVFQEAAPGTLFVGGVAHPRFVRLWVDQIARTLPDAAARDRWITTINGYLAPFMAERGLDWELHIGETSRELWLIRGQRPPAPGSPGEKLWRERNEPVPLAGTAAS